MLLLYVQLVFSLLWRHHSSMVVFASTSLPSTQCYPFLWVAWQNVVLEPMIFNYQNERHIVFDTFGLMLNLDSDEMLTTMKQSSTIKLLFESAIWYTWKLDKGKRFHMKWIWIEMEINTRKTHHQKYWNSNRFSFKNTRKEIVENYLIRHLRLMEWAWNKCVRSFEFSISKFHITSNT